MVSLSISLFFLQGVELKTIVQICTPSKKSNDLEVSSKLEEILLRYLTFYCNLADAIISDLRQGKNTSTWLKDPIPYRQGAIYFELLDAVRIAWTSNISIECFVFLSRTNRSSQNQFFVLSIRPLRSIFKSNASVKLWTQSDKYNSNHR